MIGCMIIYFYSKNYKKKKIVIYASIWAVLYAIPTFGASF